ncbi:hypothetical protein GCM10022221_63490 [Actinocorallia aurea]
MAFTGTATNLGTPFYADGGDDIEQVMQEMAEHGIKRLPVIEDHHLIGMISEAVGHRPVMRPARRRPRSAAPLGWGTARRAFTVPSSV